MVGLSNVDNTADTAKPVSTAQQTALDLKAPIASPTFTGTVAGVSKSMVGLSNVDNTADTAKPVSTAQQTALDEKQAGHAALNHVVSANRSVAQLSALDATSSVQTQLDAKAPLASSTLTGSVGIGNPTKANLGLTIHQSGSAASGISIYATGGNDAVVDLMENSGDFGHASNGSTGFRCMYDGGSNQFKIRSADDDNVNDRLTIERDSGDLEISGNVNIASGKLFKINDVGIFAAPSFGSAASGVTQSSGDNSTKIATTAYVDAASGGSSLRIYNTSDSSSADYTGNYNTHAVQVGLTDTNVIAFWEDYGTTSHSASPYFKLPQLSTVTVGTMYTFRNATKNRHTHVRAYGAEGSPEQNIFTGLTDQSADGSSDRLTSNYSNFKILQFTCIARANGAKCWFGNFVETG